MFSHLKKLVVKNWPKIILLALLLVLAILILIWFLIPEVPLANPFLAASNLWENNTKQVLGKTTPLENPKKVWGFLPYWNLNNTSIQPEVNSLIYFSLTIDGKGNVITKQDGGAEPGYHKLEDDQLFKLVKEANPKNKTFQVSFTQFNNDDIYNFLTHQENWQNFLTSIDALLIAYPIDGINIDIEYTGEISDQLRQDFVGFMGTLQKHLKTKYQGVSLSIDMYSSAASKNLIWDVKAISEQVDYIIIMAYDYYRRSSPQAGPVAPLFDSNEAEDDISHHLKNFIEAAPREKLILGIPFYGYEWQTTDAASKANTYPGTGSTATYKRVKELMNERNKINLTEHWDNYALSPFLTYQETSPSGEKSIYVVYYENHKSLAYKLDYVNQLDLAGIAIWALGYEGQERDLWQTIREKL